MITEWLLDQLVPAARLAAPFIQSMVEKGLTTTAMQSALEAANLSFRRTDFLAVVRAAKEVAAVRPYLASLRDTLMIDPTRLAAPLTRTLEDFSFKVRLEGTDEETGEKLTHFVTIATSQNLTKSQIKSAALAMVEEMQGEAPKSDFLAGFAPDRAFVDGGTFQG